MKSKRKQHRQRPQEATKISNKINNEKNRKNVNVKVAHEECETVFVSHEENPTAAAANKETALLNNELRMKDIMNNNEYWIGDTGATNHMTNNSEGIYNCAYPTESTQVVMGNGTS